MMQGQSPVACADEISTGLDAAVTYDIIHSIVSFSKAAMTTRVISLLQPGPESFSLFDEVILLSMGHVIYAGPIDEVVDYFASLGYQQPSTMDVADFLQLLPTSDGAMLFDPATSSEDEHYTTERFAQAFRRSVHHDKIANELSSSSPFCWSSFTGTDDDSSTPKKHRRSSLIPIEFRNKYQNSFLQTTALNFSRHFTLWKRDKGYIIGKMFENIGMAVATGGILFNAGRVDWDTDNVIDGKDAERLLKFVSGVYGALFMTSFHILLGMAAMNVV